MKQYKQIDGQLYINVWSTLSTNAGINGSRIANPITVVLFRDLWDWIKVPLRQQIWAVISEEIRHSEET